MSTMAKARPVRSVGFFTDTTVCIGCKACESACKQWNQLPDDGLFFTGMSYDNTAHLDGSTWRHVEMAERPVSLPGQEAGLRRPFSWLLASDVCKHCARAGCLEACPTGSLVRTEFDTVYVQPDVCNGCGYCVTACPFGVIDRLKNDGRAWKCTLCYDRLKVGLEPACAKACPTDSILFGETEQLRAKARERLAQLHDRGVHDAYLYGVDAENQPGTEGLNCFFLLVDRPEVYKLPPDPVAPAKKAPETWLAMAVAGVVMAGAAALAAARGARA